MKAPGSFAGPGLSLPGWNSVPGLRHRHSGSRSPAADSQSAGSAPTAKPAATFGAGRRRQGGPRRLRAAGRSRVEARRARSPAPHPAPPPPPRPPLPPSHARRHAGGGSTLRSPPPPQQHRRTAAARRHQLPRRRSRRRRPQPSLCLRRAPGHAYRLPTLPVAAPPHPRRPHWRPPSRCTVAPSLPAAGDSARHTHAPHPFPTHSPPSRRRLTAPIPPDSATRLALALPTNGARAPHPYQPHPTAPSHCASPTAFVALLYSGTTDVFPRASSPRSTTPAPTPFPPSTPPALSPSEQMQIDHATIPPHTHLSYVPPVCNTSHLSLLCEDRHTIIRG
jgi:hypothetical protein